MNAHSKLLEILPYFASDGDEIRVLASVAEGLLKGLRVYGPMSLDTDRRNMRAETMEEMRDGLIYLTAAMLQER